MEYNRIKSNHLILDKVAKTQTLEKRQSLQQVMLEKLDIHVQKTETTYLSLILYKN
jgi:hypothetical protein